MTATNTTRLIGNGPDRWMLWLRPEIERTVDWGGDPTNKALAAAEGPSIRLSPRKSFEKWQHVVRGHSAPWAAWQLGVCEALPTAGREIDDAIERLRTTAQALLTDHGRALDTWIDDLLTAVPGTLDDDLTIVALRPTGAPTCP
ncbi:MAG: histidine kinase [Aeromicrobium sp.]|nr:histidine kinase [Aeromicrobium sp.]